MGLDIRKGNFKSLLDRLQNLLVLVRGDERDSKTLGTETACTTDAVQIRVRIGGEIIVDSKVDTLDIDTTSKNVGSDTDTLVKFLEFLVAADTGGGSVQ